MLKWSADFKIVIKIIVTNLRNLNCGLYSLLELSDQ